MKVGRQKEEGRKVELEGEKERKREDDVCTFLIIFLFLKTVSTSIRMVNSLKEGNSITILPPYQFLILKKSQIPRKKAVSTTGKGKA
jgi:hypothetical protein